MNESSNAGITGQVEADLVRSFEALIEFSYLGHLLFFNIILKGLPLCVLGIWLYWRRELALTMKQ